jgi:acetoin utilization protein AcuB
MNHCAIDPGQYVDVGSMPRRLRVLDHMTRPAITIGWDEPLANAWRLMKIRRIRRLPVIDADGVLVGVVTEADLMEAAGDLSTHGRRLGPAGAPATVIVGKAMTWGALSVRQETMIEETARLMHDRRLTAMPVVENGRVVGILTEVDVFRALIDVLRQRAAPANYRCGF